MVLAALVDRTPDWLSKVENDRIAVDRLPVIAALATALGIGISQLIGGIPSGDNEEHAVDIGALRGALLNYQHLPPFQSSRSRPIPSASELADAVAFAWNSYQDCRYQHVLQTLPTLLSDLHDLRNAGDTRIRGVVCRQLALAYQVASVMLTKLGHADLAWVSAERGLYYAQDGDDIAIQGSVARALVHSLQATGRHFEAVQLAYDASTVLRPHLGDASQSLLAVYGMIQLAGSMAAARNGDRIAVRDFLSQAETAAARIGGDTNLLWTSFGPTNIAIHRTSTAMTLGDVQAALHSGTHLDVSTVTPERQARHNLEIARANMAWNRRDEALTTLLHAEHIAPEQVAHHAISRQVIVRLLRGCKGRPSPALLALARRADVDQAAL